VAAVEDSLSADILNRLSLVATELTSLVMENLLTMPAQAACVVASTARAD